MYIIASEEKKPYGFKPEDVSEIYKAQMIIASDGAYFSSLNKKNVYFY